MSRPSGGVSVRDLPLAPDRPDGLVDLVVTPADRKGPLRRARDARRALPKNVRVLGWVSLANDSASELAYPILPLFLVLVLNAPIIAVGLIDGIPEAIAALVRLVSGWLSDRSAHRRRRWIFAGYGISSAARVLMAAAPTWGWALGARGLDRVGKGARGTPRDALIRASSRPEQVGSSFGYHRAMDTIGAIIGPLVAAALLASGVSLRTALWVAVVPGLLTLVLTRFIRDVAPEHEPGAHRRLFPTPVRSLPPVFWRATAIWLLFSIGNSSDVFLLLRARQLGLGTILVVLSYAVYNVFFSAFSWPLGALSDRVSRHAVLAGGFALFALTYLGFAFAPSAWVVYPLFCLYGVYIAATEGVAKAWIADHVDVPLVGTAYGVFGLGTGLTLLVSSVLAGVLWVEVSPAAPFLLGGIAAALAALFLVWDWKLMARNRVDLAGNVGA